MRTDEVTRDDESGRFAKQGEETTGKDTITTYSVLEKQVLNALSGIANATDQAEVDAYFYNAVQAVLEVRAAKTRKLTEMSCPEGF